MSKFVFQEDSIRCPFPNNMNEDTELLQTNNTDELYNMLSDFERNDNTIINDKHYK